MTGLLVIFGVIAVVYFLVKINSWYNDSKAYWEELEKKRRRERIKEILIKKAEGEVSELEEDIEWEKDEEVLKDLKKSKKETEQTLAILQDERKEELIGMMEEDLIEGICLKGLDNPYCYGVGCEWNALCNDKRKTSESVKLIRM
jgi:hypothetical protein